jgi:GNAT superfamily N-acetyltransferase
MGNIKISFLNESQIPQLLDFSRSIYPERSNIEDRAFWFSFNNPFLKTESRPPVWLALDENNKIVGQFMLNNQEWHFQGITREGFFGYDFFVEESCRKTGAGALLMIKAIRKCTPFFGLGLAKDSQKMFSAGGLKVIGSLGKFLWINRIASSILHSLKYFLKRGTSFKVLAKVDFPAFLDIEGVSFKLLSDSPDSSYNDYHDPEAIEFSRSHEFLKWRFFKSKIKYYFYYCSSREYPIYFVLRPAQRKGLNLLSIVDYKVPLGQELLWNLILRASKKIARLLSFDGIVTASSHVFFNQGLKDEKFFPAGKPAPILSTISTSAKPAVYFTMADADIDLNFGENQ